MAQLPLKERPQDVRLKESSLPEIAKPGLDEGAPEAYQPIEKISEIGPTADQTGTLITSEEVSRELTTQEAPEHQIELTKDTGDVTIKTSADGKVSAQELEKILGSKL